MAEFIFKFKTSDSRKETELPFSANTREEKCQNYMKFIYFCYFIELPKIEAKVTTITL